MSAALVEAPAELGVSNLDDEPECQDGGYVGEPDEDCPNPARWQYRGLCGHPWIVCDEHHDEIVIDRLPIRCTCGVPTPNAALKWRHL